jgi:hypothetical protein
VALVEPSKEVQDKRAITNRLIEGTESVRYLLKLATVLGDQENPWVKMWKAVCRCQGGGHESLGYKELGLKSEPYLRARGQCPAA